MTQLLSSMDRRTRRALALALCLAAAASLNACGKKEAPPAAPPKPEVPVMAVVQQDVPVFQELVGQTRGSQDIEITARVEGWLEGIHFKEGSQVAKGSLLYSIDPRPIQEEVAAAEGKLAAARAQVAAAQSQVAEAGAQVGAAQAQLAQAEGDVAKFKPLVAMNAISRRDLDNAVAQRDAAQEQLRAAKERVQASEGGVRAAQGQVDAAKAQVEYAKIKLGYTKVYAPVSGLIGKTKAQVGDLVGRPPNVVLNTVSALEPIFVEFSLNEREYLDLTRRMTGRTEGAGKAGGLELTLADGSVYPQKGTLNFADRQVDPTTGTILLQATFPNPQKLLRPGQFARVRGVVETKKGALLVPQKAVQELQGQHQVFVVGAGDKVEVRNVKMSQRVGELWVADEGLKPGDRVIVDGLQKLKADLVVTPKPAAPPPPPEGGQPAAPPAAAPEAPAAPAKPAGAGH